MYGCESWTMKKAERRRIDAFELWCWRRLLRVPWTARRSNQSILKEISPGIFLEGMMLKLKLQYFGHLMWRVDTLKRFWCWEGLGAGGEGTTEDEMAGWHHWLDGRESGWTLGVGDGQGGLACCDWWGRKESDTTERLNWTELKTNRANVVNSNCRSSFLCHHGNLRSLSYKKFSLSLYMSLILYSCFCSVVMKILCLNRSVLSFICLYILTMSLFYNYDIDRYNYITIHITISMT